MGAHSVAWDHGYEDYYDGNGANPYEDIHLLREWFEGWEAARQVEIEREFEDKI